MNTRFHRITRFAQSALSAAALATLLGFSPAVQAQQQMTPGGMHGGQPAQFSEEQKAVLMELQSVQQQMQQTQQNLQRIQQQAFKNNPKLVSERQALEKLMFEKMSTGGYQAQQEFQALQSMVQKFQGGQTQPTQQQMADFQKRQQVFQQRQQQALQDSEVQKQSKSLQQAVQEKMAKIDANAPALIKKMQTLSQQFMQLRQKMAQM